jgi:hypothetical protein
MNSPRHSNGPSVEKFRKPYHHESDFVGLDLSPRVTDIVIVKIGYLEPEPYRTFCQRATLDGGCDDAQDAVDLDQHRQESKQYITMRVISLVLTLAPELQTSS